MLEIHLQFSSCIWGSLPEDNDGHLKDISFHIWTKYQAGLWFSWEQIQATTEVLSYLLLMPALERIHQRCQHFLLSGRLVPTEGRDAHMESQLIIFNSQGPLFCDTTKLAKGDKKMLQDSCLPMAVIKHKQNVTREIYIFYPRSGKVQWKEE